ncbi:GntR family transcriptional regulator [Ramlibacter rhizophilus]|uniref:GntR family transcriptional regulator n=1 Tax=Ramlibacter rhizophilus TaxID=1781167 RepID=UPI0014327AED|nr:GntR family transcriptional regulator [Ramlibacter rhizophilus]
MNAETPMTEEAAAARGPRYQQLTDTLVREIREGRYPVGSLLPPEPQLCQRFAVSRHTVREAVRHLCEMGLVSRHQGVGTRVRAARGDKQYVASLSTLGDLMAYARGTRLEVLGSRWVDADEALAAQLRCGEGEHWLELDTCRYATLGGEPIVHMRVYVRPEAAGMREELERGQAWVFGLVEKYGGERILEAQQVVGAVAVPADSARVLGVRAKSPGLLVRRFYLGRGDRLLSVSVNVHPVGRFELTTTWRLEEAAGRP